VTISNRLAALVPGGCVVGALLLLLSTAPAMAEDQSFNFELTPFGAARFGGTLSIRDSDESWEFDDSSSFGLVLNWRHSGETMWEVLYSKQQTDAVFSAAVPGDQPVDIDLQVLQLGGTYQFDGNKAIPYLAATIGGTHARARATGSETDTFWSGSIGGGVLISPGTRVGLRLEARYYGTLASSNTDLFCGSGPAGGGCAIRIEGDLLSQFEVFAGVVIRF
jgi:hypothetical protein